MIPFEEAVDRVRRSARRGPVETVPLGQALGRALAQPVTASIDSPPFDRSAMDGYAVAGGDTGEPYRIVQTVAAGALPRAIGPGECARIMTGAMLPAGAARVIRLEYAREAAGHVHVVREETQSNVIPRGENLRAGDAVLTPRRLAPQDIGILASLGLAAIPVTARPVVGVLTTGTELARAGTALEGAAIYDSNGPQLCAHLECAGCAPLHLGTVSDAPEAIASRLAQGAEGCTVLIVSGGVSLGDFDYVPGALVEAGFVLDFHRVAVRPGMPTLFGRRGDTYVFGLPGNPVSTFVVFEVLVRPLLHGLLGLPEEATLVPGRLAAAVRRRQSDRVELRPVRLDRGRVYPVVYHGSSDLPSLAQANALLELEVGVSALEEGAEVHVRPVR
jgi:molybdopterin molybdotransferase